MRWRKPRVSIRCCERRAAERSPRRRSRRTRPTFLFAAARGVQRNDGLQDLDDRADEFLFAAARGVQRNHCPSGSGNVQHVQFLFAAARGVQRNGRRQYQPQSRQGQFLFAAARGVQRNHELDVRGDGYALPFLFAAARGVQRNRGRCRCDRRHGRFYSLLREACSGTWTATRHGRARSFLFAAARGVQRNCSWATSMMSRGLVSIRCCERRAAERPTMIQRCRCGVSIRCCERRAAELALVACIVIAYQVSIRCCERRAAEPYPCNWASDQHERCPFACPMGGADAPCWWARVRGGVVAGQRSAHPGRGGHDRCPRRRERRLLCKSGESVHAGPVPVPDSSWS